MKIDWHKRLLQYIGGGLVSIGFPAAIAAGNPILIGTGDVDGLYYPMGQYICQSYLSMANSQQENTSETGDNSCQAQITQGSVANLYRLADEQLDFALVQSDWQHYAYTGTYLFAAQGDQSHLRSVFALYYEPFTVLVHQEADIESFDDLVGKRVSIGELGSGNRATLEVLMRIKGQTMAAWESVTINNAADKVEALCDKEIDAIITTIGHPNPWVEQVMAQCPVTLLSVNDSNVNALISRTPFYTSIRIPHHIYPSLAQDVVTFGVTAVLVTRTDVPDKVVYQLVDSIFSDLPRWQQQLPELALLTPEDMLNVGEVPLHSGALQYFQAEDLL